METALRDDDKRVLLDPHVSQSQKMASDISAQRISITEEQLRGVSVHSLVAGGARLFADNGVAAREDPQGTYAVSKPVERLDYFVSHAWRSPRVSKWLALLCYFNLNAALVAYLVACLLSFIYATMFFESLDDFFVMPKQPVFLDNVSHVACFFAQIFASVAFGLVFFFGHLVFRRGESAFLDICCIDQLDAENKASGINSLGALLDRSRRMVVLLDESNMKRMWCTFEVAAFAKRGSMDRMDLVPLHLSLQTGALVFANLTMPIIGLFFNEFESDSPFLMMLTMAPVLGTIFLLLVHATWLARTTSKALEGLRSFTLSDCECYSHVDKAAILELIGRWFADESHVGIEGRDKQMALDVGYAAARPPKPQTCLPSTPSDMVLGSLTCGAACTISRCLCGWKWRTSSSRRSAVPAACCSGRRCCRSSS